MKPSKCIYVIYRLGGLYREKLWLRSEYADRGLWAEVSIFRPRSHFFPIRTDHKLVNNLFVFPPTDKHTKGWTRGESPQGVFHKKGFMKILEIFGNLQKLLEIFVNSSEVFSSIFIVFLKFSENLRKSSEAFRNLWDCSGKLQKFSNNFGSSSKVIFRFFKIFGKSLESFENFWKTSETVQK